ncbi:MAG: 5'/3'-nucleotidase SurE [Bacillota bacterium]
MNILLVNDDGIKSSRLEFAEKVLKEFGDVTVVAPEEQQSGKSTSITIDSVPFRKIDENKYAIEGTPADCVSFGLFGLNLDPDVIVSGVNKGYNIGVDILYSGTVGAALQGNYFSKKTIALSGDFLGKNIVEGYLKQTLEYIFDEDLPSEDYVVNVNFPADDFKAPKGIRITKPFFRRARLIPKIENNVFKHTKEFLEQHIPEDSDVYANLNGYISISKLKLNNSI